MSLPRRIEIACSVCGETSSQTVLASTNTMGAPDLDLRPPEMKRSTMNWWIQECPHCGAVAFSLNRPAPVDKAWLQRKEYVTCNGLEFASNLAKRFYKQYLIASEGKDYDKAWHSALYAAWACDDAQDRQNAALCRTLCLEAMEAHSEEGDFLASASEDFLLQRADIMRRAGQFDRLLREYGTVTFSQELLNRLLAFELEKAKQSDTRCYRVSDVIA